MTKPIANVNIATDSFATWIGITNQTADAFTKYAVTANTDVNGGSTTGNATVVGIFAATTLAATSALRGGNVTSTANLTITSNGIFTGALVKSTANVYIEAANTYVNGANFSVVGGQVTSTSNAYFQAANVHSNGANFRVVGGQLTSTSNVSFRAANVHSNGANFTVVGGQATSTSNVYFSNANTYVNATSFKVVGGEAEVTSNIVFNNTTTHVNSALTLQTHGIATVISNSNLGSTTASPVEIFSFGKTTYRSAKITSSAVSLTGNTQTQELILACSNEANDVTITAYGTVSAPAGVNVGTYSTSINATHVAVNFRQVSPNTAVKVFVQYIK